MINLMTCLNECNNKHVLERSSEDAIVRNISIGGLKKLYWFHFL